MKYTAVRGTKDILPPESRGFEKLEQAARQIFALYGFEEIRTPTFEQMELFTRSIGETSDIVEKEMYVFEDRGGRQLALRPEGTAGVVRAYIEHSLNVKSAITKLYYIGPMFRAERPQAGRYREFWQVGAEYFGNASPVAEAEIISLILSIFKSFGVSYQRVRWNNLGCSNCRPVYRKALLEYLEKHRDSLCDDCKRRIDRNPLRALDCKIDGERMFKEGAPRSFSYLCDACANHHKEFRNLWPRTEEPPKNPELYWIVESPSLVRGLDYYNRIVFEVLDKDGLALAAGGRYDQLVKSLGGPEVPAVGFALGTERTLAAASLAAEEKGQTIFVAVQSKELAQDAFGVLSLLRGSGFKAEGGYSEKSLKAQMRLADSLGARYTVILGAQEKENGVVTLRDMQGQSQREIPMASIVEELTRLLPTPNSQPPVPDASP